MALAKRQVNPSRSSIALRRMAPPSELACGWSNFAMIGLEIPWTWRALCAIQAVAIEPPRFCAMSRLVNALFAHFRGSMALFFHRSRIIRASGRWAEDREVVLAELVGGIRPAERQGHAFAEIGRLDVNRVGDEERPFGELECQDRVGRWILREVAAAERR